MDPAMAQAAAQSMSSLFSGVFGYLGNKAKAKAEKASALQASHEAGVEAGMELAQGDAVAARAATQVAANGGGFGGSSLAVIDQLSSQAMFNARRAIYGGETEARAHLYNAKVAKKNATLALVNGVVGSVSPAFKAAADAKTASNTASLIRTSSSPASTDGSTVPDLAGLY